MSLESISFRMESFRAHANFPIAAIYGRRRQPQRAQRSHRKSFLRSMRSLRLNVFFSRLLVLVAALPVSRISELEHVELI